MTVRPKSTRPAAGRRKRRDDRPYLIVLFGLFVVIGAMAMGPMRSLAAANERVDELAEDRDVLAEEVGKLEQRKADLNDPAEQEVYAREQLGLVRPGEVPYVVLPDERGADGPAAEASPGDGEDQNGDGEGQDTGGEPPPWYQRLADAVTSVFGG